MKYKYHSLTNSPASSPTCLTHSFMKNYFRITGYYPEHDFSFIIDSNGMFEKLWQFSSMLISKGLKVIEVSNSDKFIDVNIEPIEKDANHIILRATAEGKPEYITQTINGVTHKAVKVGGRIYTLNKNNINMVN